MNDFAFGGALAGTAESVEINKIAHEGAAMIEVVGTLPWLRPLMQVMPQVKLRRLRDMSLAQVQRRRVAGSKVRDLMYYLVSPCIPAPDYDANEGMRNSWTKTMRAHTHRCRR
jgi:hypothetical protein